MLSFTHSKVRRGAIVQETCKENGQLLELVSQDYRITNSNKFENEIPESKDYSMASHFPKKLRLQKMKLLNANL
jgi:hypothetical protein